MQRNRSSDLSIIPYLFPFFSLFLCEKRLVGLRCKFCATAKVKLARLTLITLAKDYGVVGRWMHCCEAVIIIVVVVVVVVAVVVIIINVLRPTYD